MTPEAILALLIVSPLAGLALGALPTFLTVAFEGPRQVRTAKAVRS